MAAFLLIVNEPSMTGESRDPKHRGWIDVVACSLDVASSRHGSSARSGTADRRHNDIRITKPMDRTSPSFLQACATGQQLPRVILDVVSADGRGGTWYEFIDVFVTSVTPRDISPGGEPLDDVTLNFASARAHTGFYIAVAVHAAGFAKGAISGATIAAKSRLRAVKKK